MEIFIYLALATFPAMVAIGVSLLKRESLARMATRGIWLVMVGLVLVGWRASTAGSFPWNGWGFRILPLGLVLSLFILFISGIVHLFSIRYMSGDRLTNPFFIKLGFLTSSLLLMIGTDHLLLMLVFWISSNLLLANLMIHKNDWPAARNGGILMIKISFLGSGFLALAISILALSFNSFSLHEILENPNLITYPVKLTVLLFLIIAALVQSGAWPFHKWLISSLNSPTPVSGLMHAGLVNGGGFLLIRFAPLFADISLSLHIVFILGLISVILGTAWKLMQNNIKAMLACSTMAQMGFMLMQCGLGLFSAAIAHLFWHGLFKCYLFLNSGSAIQERKEPDIEKNLLKYLSALAVGFVGAYGFGLMIGFSFEHWSTKIVLIGFSWLASAQIAYSFLNKGLFWVRIAFACVGSLMFGMIYGATIYLVESFVSTMRMDANLPIHPIHIVGMGIVMLISIGIHTKMFSPFSSRRLYMEMLNLSQSHSKTKTLIRNEYKY